MRHATFYFFYPHPLMCIRLTAGVIHFNILFYCSCLLTEFCRRLRGVTYIRVLETKLSPASSKIHPSIHPSIHPLYPHHFTNKSIIQKYYPILSSCCCCFVSTDSNVRCVSLFIKMISIVHFCVLLLFLFNLFFIYLYFEFPFFQCLSKSLGTFDFKYIT